MSSIFWGILRVEAVHHVDDEGVLRVLRCVGGDRGRGNGQRRIIPGTGCGNLWGVQDEGRRGFIYPERGGCNLSLTDERRGNRVLEKRADVCTKMVVESKAE